MFRGRLKCSQRSIQFSHIGTSSDINMGHCSMVHIKWHYQYGPGNQKKPRRETRNKELGDLNEHESWVSFPKLLLSLILYNTFKVLLVDIVPISYTFFTVTSVLVTWFIRAWAWPWRGCTPSLSSPWPCALSCCRRGSAGPPPSPSSTPRAGAAPSLGWFRRPTGPWWTISPSTWDRND